MNSLVFRERLITHGSKSWKRQTQIRNACRISRRSMRLRTKATGIGELRSNPQRKRKGHQSQGGVVADGQTRHAFASQKAQNVQKLEEIGPTTAIQMYPSSRHSPTKSGSPTYIRTLQGWVIYRLSRISTMASLWLMSLTKAIPSLW